MTAVVCVTLHAVIEHECCNGQIRGRWLFVYDIDTVVIHKGVRDYSNAGRAIGGGHMTNTKAGRERR